MALTIGDRSMTSDRSVHTAMLLPGARYTWVVSWLPGRHLDHGKAVAAMTIADITADGNVAPERGKWPDIKNCAADLHLTSAEALNRVAAPPQWDKHPASVLEFGEVNGFRAVLEDPDPIDLGIADEYFDDWPYAGSPDFDGTADDPIGLTWTGKEPPGPAPQQHRMVSIPLQSVPRLDDRALPQALNQAEADRPSLLAPGSGKQEQPVQEPDTGFDWEAGE